MKSPKKVRQIGEIGENRPRRSTAEVGAKARLLLKAAVAAASVAATSIAADRARAGLQRLPLALAAHGDLAALTAARARAWTKWPRPLKEMQ